MILRNGACLFTKRLEKGRFLWPSPAGGALVGWAFWIFFLRHLNLSGRSGMIDSIWEVPWFLLQGGALGGLILGLPALAAALVVLDARGNTSLAAYAVTGAFIATIIVASLGLMSDAEDEALISFSLIGASLLMGVPGGAVAGIVAWVLRPPAN